MLLRRTWAASALLAGCAAALSGCVGENYGPVQISTVDGQMAVAFCDDHIIDSIQILQLPPGGERYSGWQVLWDARGPRAVTEGEVVLIGASDSGFSLRTYNPVFSPEADYDYQLTVEVKEGIAYGPVFQSPPGGLVDGQWLTTSGKLVDTPCTY